MQLDEGQRLDAALSIARRVRDPFDSLGREARKKLLASSGLSREGLELALTQHLEADASATDRARLFAWALDGRAPGEPPSGRCHVVLSSNVVTGAFRAIVLGLLSAPEVLVKPSRREPAFPTLLVREIGPLLASGSLALVDSLAAVAGDRVHAYGNDASLDAIERSLLPGVHFRGHGSGFGVAVIDETADIDAAASTLARDVVAFDQRGCLSPRVALVLGGPARARSVALALHQALTDLGQKIPRGELDTGTATELASFRQTMQALGELWEERDHLVAFDDAATELVLPPAARAVAVLACSDLSAAARMLEPVSRWITTLGLASSRDGAAFDALRPRGARVAMLGAMQAPPLDGPVDERER